MIKIKRKHIVAGIVVLIIIGYFVASGFFKKPSDSYITEKAVRGEVLQEISETGSVKATESVSMGFKSIGKIAKINIAKGDNVKKGALLVQLDLSQASAQLQSAQAALEASRHQYEKLLSGLTAEDIKIYQDAVTLAKHDLQSAYDSSLNTLNDAYIKIYNAYTTANSIQSSYFGLSDQQGIKVIDAKNDINRNMQDIKNYLDDDIDKAVSRMLVVLGNVYNDLKIIREQCDDGIYYSMVSSTDKSSLDTQKGYINTASTNITTSQQDINSYKINLQKAEDNLVLKTATPRQEDIDIYRSEVDKAQANVNLYQSQLSDVYLKSPIDGKVTEVNAKIGEVVSASEAIINLLSADPFQIKVNIYEQDIINVKLGDPVSINLVAFPNQPEGIKSGMTADIIIKTNSKDNVLRVAKNAIENINGKDMLQVITNGKVEDRQITAGLEGNDYVEVLSGLSEGEEVITGKK